MRVDVVTLGHLGVRRSFLQMAGPSWLQLPRVVLDPRWTPVPVNVYVVRTEHMILLVDTGEEPAASDRSHFADDALLRASMALRMFRFDLPPERRLTTQLEGLGIAPTDVTHVVLSHLHFDHAGTLTPFEGAEVLVSDTEVRAQGHRRVADHRSSWPAWFPERATRVSHGDGPWGPFAASHVLDDEGRFRLVPTPGHTAGHQCLVVEDGDRALVFGGDSTFTLDQLDRGGIGALTEDARSARASNDRLRRLLADRRGVYLPAHDPAAASRLVS